MKNERVKDMKNNIMMILVLGMLMLCLLPLALNAQTAQKWQSTSSMQGSGSAYSSQVTAVGATGVGSMATTTYSPTQASSGPRRSKEKNEDLNADPDSPLGDAVLPLLLMAAGFGLYTAVRKRKEVA